MEASLREHLRAQIDGAQAELAANLAQLRNNPSAEAGLIAKGDAQLGALLALARQLDNASPVALAMMRATVAASVAASSTLAQQANAATSTAQGSGGPSFAAASAAARSTVNAFERDMYERKIFDPYLTFTSEADEEAYRKREAERHEETKKAEAEHTPQGDLRALKVSLDQLKDAGAHGATASPDFAPTMEGIITAKDRLLNAVATQKVAPSSVQMATSDDRSEVKASVNMPSDIVASLRAAGVTVTDPNEDGHGVSARTPSASNGLGRA